MAQIPHPHSGKKLSESGIGRELLQGKWYAWAFWGIVATFYLYEFFIRVTPSVILPELTKDFDVTPGSTATAMSTYLWVYAPMQLAVGVLLDRWGSKYVVSTAAMLCAVGCILFSMADELFMAGFGRGFIGFGSAFAFVGAIYVATVWFPPNRLGLIAGITLSVGMIGEIIGQYPVSVLTTDYGWQKVVFWSGIIGAFLGLCMLILIPRRPSWFENRFSHDDERRIGVLHSLFILLKNPQIWIIGLISAVLYLPMSVIAALWGTSYLEETMNIDTDQSTAIITMLAVGWLFGCPIFGRLSDSFENRRLPILIGCIGGTLTLGLFLLAPQLSFTTMLILVLVMGLCTSTQSITFAIVIEVSPRQLAATAVSTCNFITMMLAGLLQVAIGWILDWRMNLGHGLAPAPARATVHGNPNHVVAQNAYEGATSGDFIYALAVIPLLFAVTIVLSFFLKETRGRNICELSLDP